MKITFDTDGLQYEHKEFLTKAEYDEDEHSPAGVDRRHAEPWGRRRGYPIERYRDNPEKFPCLAIISYGRIYNANGPDEIPITYIYDYTKVESE